jgi:D-alanine-D-alanine ligase
LKILGYNHPVQIYTVAVIRGGPTWEPEESKKSGRAVLDALAALGHRTIDIVVDNDGAWVRQGMSLSPREASRGADVIWNAVVGGYGEDGRAQRDLRSTGLPFTGPTDLSAALANHKHHTKEVLRRAGVRTPIGKVVERQDPAALAVELFRVCPMPAIVKPADRGGSIGVSVARTIPELAVALHAAFAVSPKAIVEEWIDGREATVGVVEGFRGQGHYALPTVEVCIGGDCRHYTCEMKKEGKGAKLVCPGSFDGKSREEIYDAARKAHEALGLRDISRIDIIHHPRRGAYVVEANAVPSVAPGSPIWRSLLAVGADLKQLVGHVLDRAVGRR